ncbi:MAG TPA: prepilin-type N-terminal cleavage/methylation domain-containing protein [Candidatus Pacearchaeota archaeon]|nr:prepilin-type N-terminal cleavage/methylation domain-containing protein [Candidatus Pacearchaeota archaeon]
MRHKKKKIKKENGVTLIELLISIAIIIILSSITFIDYRGEEKKLNLEKSAFKLVQDLRGIEAKTGAEFEGCKDENGNYDKDYKYQYGAYFDINNKNKYILFADCNGDYQYDKNTDKIIDGGEIELEKGIEMESIFPETDESLYIVFTLPDPVVTINYNNDESFNIGKIELKIKDSSETKTITIYKTGLIEIN